MKQAATDMLAAHWKRLGEQGIYTSIEHKIHVMHGEAVADAYRDSQLADGSRTADGVERVPVPDAFLDAIKGKKR